MIGLLIGIVIGMLPVEIWGINNCSIYPAPAKSPCCNRPRMLDNSAFRNCDRSHQFQDIPTIGCAEYECFFIVNNFYVNSEFRKDMLVNYLSDVAASSDNPDRQQPNWKALVDDSFDICAKRIEESEQEVRQAYLDNYEINPANCNAKFVAMISCMYYQIFINCPREAWHDSVQCNDWKDYVLSCLENIENLPLINMDYMYDDDH